MGGHLLSLILLHGQKHSREETFSRLFFFCLLAKVNSGEIFQNVSTAKLKRKEKEDFPNGLIENLFSKPKNDIFYICLLYTSPSPRDKRQSRMPSSA